MNSKQLKTIFKTGAMAMMCACMLSPAQAITVYKSIGEFGEVKYSQFPPKDSKDVEVIELRSNGRQVDTGQMAGKTNANQEEPPTPEQQRISQLEAKAKEREKQENAERCQTLRNNLTNLNTGGRVYTPDENGGRKFLNDREIEQQRSDVQNLIDQYCTGTNT